MGVYITTSRNPSSKTKTLCRALSSVLPESIYESRGGKNTERIFSRAKLLGKSRVLLVYETSGVPSKICFMKVKAHSWEWVGEELSISRFRVYKIPGELPREVVPVGERKEEFEELFDFDKPESDDFIELRYEKKALSFSYGKPLIRMGLIQ